MRTGKHKINYLKYILSEKDAKAGFTGKLMSELRRFELLAVY